MSGSSRIPKVSWWMIWPAALIRAGLNRITTELPNDQFVGVMSSDRSIDWSNQILYCVHLMLPSFKFDQLNWPVNLISWIDQLIWTVKLACWIWPTRPNALHKLTVFAYTSQDSETEVLDTPMLMICYVLCQANFWSREDLARPAYRNTSDHSPIHFRNPDIF